MPLYVWHYHHHHLWLCSPAEAMASSFTRFVDLIQRRATVGKTPFDEWLVRRRDIHLTTHTTNIHTPGGIFFNIKSSFLNSKQEWLQVHAWVQYGIKKTLGFQPHPGMSLELKEDTLHGKYHSYWDHDHLYLCSFGTKAGDSSRARTHTHTHTHKLLYGKIRAHKKWQKIKMWTLYIILQCY
jgi:hypothetical protein